LTTSLHFVLAHPGRSEAREVGALEFVDHPLHQVVVEAFRDEPSAELCMRQPRDWIAKAGI
jgi:hypothetical protein